MEPLNNSLPPSPIKDDPMLKTTSSKFIPFLVATIWACYISAVILNRILLSSTSANESPFTLVIAGIVFVIVGLIVLFTTRFIKNKYILVVFIILPFLIPTIFPYAKIDPNNYFLNKAISENNEFYCSKMLKYVNDCYKTIAEKKSSLQICDLINTNEPSNEMKWKCYLSLAKQKNDSTICSVIPVMNDYVWVTNMWDDCFSSTSQDPKASEAKNAPLDVSSCSNIQDNKKRFECIAKISPLKAASLCEEEAYHFGVYQENAFRCYNNLVNSFNAPVEVCTYIKAPSTDPRPEVYELWKHKCMKTSLSKNPSQVIPPNEKASWEEYAAKYKVKALVNNSEQPTSISYGSTFNFSWVSSDFDSCSLTIPASYEGSGTEGDYVPVVGTWDSFLSESLKLPKNGNVDFIVKQRTSTKGTSITIEIACTNFNMIENIKAAVTVPIK